MARFDLKDYDLVETRITKFWTKYPDGAIVTQNVTTEGDRERRQWVVEASVYRHRDDIRPTATGMAFETDGGMGANQTSALENCETSAIGRALANFTFSGNKRASREEMSKVARGTVTPIGIETIDPQKATNLEQLNTMWEQAVLFGSSKDLQAAFSARKKELGG